MNHTPTPWHWKRYKTSMGKMMATIGGSDRLGAMIACVKPENAEFIVRACNAHEELLAALEALEPFFSQVEAHGGRKAVQLADEAIAKAEGKI